MDLDLDLVFENDRVRDFLQNKLQEIEDSNRNLQEMIKRRKHIFSCLSEISNSNLNDFKVLFSWKKIFNGQCAFGYEVRNISHINLKLCRIISKSHSSEILNFRTHIVSESDLICSEGTAITKQEVKIIAKAYIVIVINLPQFLDRLTYTLKASIFHKQNEIDFIFDLPVVEITSADIINKDLNAVSVQTGSLFDLLTVILCSLKTDLVIILPEDFTNNLNNILEINCYLTGITLPEISKKYYTAYNICPRFDNSLIEVDSSYNKLMYSFIVYTKDNKSLEALLHFLHQNVPGTLIIPKSCLQYYDIEKIAGKFDKIEAIDKFRTLIEKEIEIVNRYKNYLGSARNDCDICMHLRKKLLDAEKNTDLSYLKIISSN